MPGHRAAAISRNIDTPSAGLAHISLHQFSRRQRDFRHYRRLPFDFALKLIPPIFASGQDAAISLSLAPASIDMPIRRAGRFAAAADRHAGRVTRD